MSDTTTAESIRAEAERRGVSIWQVRKDRGASESPRARCMADGRRSLQLRLGPDVYEALRTAAEDRDVSLNWLANKGLEDFLGRLLPADDIAWTRPR